MPATADSPIKAVLFDCDGVLQWPVAGWIEGIDALMERGTFAELDRREQTSAVTGQVPFRDVVAEYLDELGETVEVDVLVA